MGQEYSRPTFEVPRLQEADLTSLPPPTREPLALRPLWSLWGVMKRVILTKEQDTSVGFHIVRTAPLEETPSWLQRRWENERNNRLYQLPEEIIMLIRDQADYPTRILLRQSCSLFLRVVSNMDLARSPEVNDAVWRTAVARFFNGRLLLPIHGTAREFENRRHEWRDIVYRDIYLELCPSCRAHRQSPEFKKRLNKLARLNDCDCAHHRHFRLYVFKKEKSKWSNIEYGCVVNESPVHLCSHLSYDWSQLYMLQPSILWQRASYCTRICDDKQHKEQSPVAVAKGRILYPRCDFVSGKMIFSWISPAFDLDPRVPVTRQHLRDFIKSHQVAAGLALSFCPHVHAQDERLLLPFEPDQCACFDQEHHIGPRSPAGQYHYHEPNSEKSADNCCRCYSQQHPEEKGKFLRPDPELLHGRRALESVRPSSCYQTVRSTAFVSSSALHEYKCSQCFAVYSWIRGMDERVYLQCRRHVDGRDRTAYTRCMIPEWASVNDSETHRITWCDDTKCKTNAYWSRIYFKPKAPAT